MHLRINDTAGICHLKSFYIVRTFPSLNAAIVSEDDTIVACITSKGGVTEEF
jgi:hypothetical protein